MEIAGTAIDGLLVCRILMLKLHRLYLFITLACLVGVFFDGVQLWLGAGSPEDIRVFLYSRFLYVFLFPLAAWDVFEEAKTEISKLRRLAIVRLISGLFFAAIFGFIVSAFVQNNETEGEPVTLATLALVLWAGASTATLAFLWTLHRQIRAQNIVRPNNTFVWMVFYELTLAGEVLNCLGVIVFPLMSQTAQDVVNLLFLTYGIGIGVWCILKLRRVASDVPSAPASASL
jgi:hypothetical protein